jgi:hypothetical protein
MRLRDGELGATNDDGRFAVITPYHRETRGVIERCIDSVKAQSVAADHFLISDGVSQDWLDDAGVTHIRLAHAHHDFGNTPRGIGAMLAVAQGYDGIGFLDVDNWYDRDHVQACRTAARDADLVIAQRRLWLGDGAPLDLPEEPGHIDTNCFWFIAGSFHLVHYWASIPAAFAALGDRVFNRMIAGRALSMRLTEKITVNYVSHWQSHYHAVGKTPPPGAKPNIEVQAALDWMLGLDLREQQLVERRCGVHPAVILAEVISRPPVSGHAPCPCGSGRAYQGCHRGTRSAISI